MKKNMGGADRVIRTTIAIIIGVLYFMGIISGTWAVVLLILASIFILTSLVGTCPMYTLLGISSCKLDNQINNKTN